MTDVPKCALAIPIYPIDRVRGELAENLFYFSPTQGQWTILWLTSCDVNYAHAVLLHQATWLFGLDWLLVMGVDQYFAEKKGLSEASSDLIMHGVRHEAAIIAAPVATQQGHNVPDFDVRKGLILPVDRVGSGFAAYNLQWFRDNWKAGGPDGWFAPHYFGGNAESPPEKTSCDYLCCDKVREAGGKVLVDCTLPVILHAIGDYIAAPKGRNNEHN